MLTDELDFRLKDHGSFYTLDPQTDRAREYVQSEGLVYIRFDHDNWLKVALLLNQNGYTVTVE